MNAIALALVLFAAVLHASWNFVSKKSGGGSSFVLLYETFAFLIYMPLLYLVDFKRLLSLPLELWLLIILSAVLHVIYTIVLQTGYRKADYSIVYPTARGTGPAFTVLVAVFLFGEKLAPLGFAGIVCVLLGIVLLAMPGKDKQLKSSLSEGLFWGVLTGVFIASYSSLDGFAIQLIGLTPLMYYVPGMAVRLLLLGPGILSKKAGRESFKEDIKKRWKYALYIGIAHPAAYLLVLFALLYAPLAYVAPTREVSMMLALFIGAKALHEKVTPLKTAGVLAMMAGVVLISLAR